MSRLQLLPALAAASAAIATLFSPLPASALDFNGWCPCPSTNDYPALELTFECALAEVPLCHPGVCESDKTIELFVRRALASQQPDSSKSVSEDEQVPSLWFLQGGPGSSSVVMEHRMAQFHSLAGVVGLYTMDHRGTGRSNYLECVAAQALANGSPSHDDISLAEWPTCVQDALFEMDDQQVAYSVTSAAKDLVFLLDAIHGLDSPQSVFMRGVSYGTLLVERVMHLAPSQVRGYILDGVLSEAGADPRTRSTFSHWNQMILAPTQRFLQLCTDQQDSCPLLLSSEENVIDQVLDIFDMLDTQDPEDNACVTALLKAFDDDVPSEALRSVLSKMVKSRAMRELIPSVLARVQNCSPSAATELAVVLTSIRYEVAGEIRTEDTAAADPLSDASPLLYNLIAMSEQWTNPPPTRAQLTQFYKDGVFSTRGTSLERYCLLSGELSPRTQEEEERVSMACREVAEAMEKNGDESIMEAFTSPPFLYEPDQYWNRTASIPPNTSVLMFNGGLDFQTPQEFGRAQFEAMELEDEATSQKLLVEMAFGGHGTGFSPTIEGDKSHCGLHIAGGFVLANGDALSVDTECLKTLPALVFSDEPSTRRAWSKSASIRSYCTTAAGIALPR